MRIASAISTARSPSAAAGEVVVRAQTGLVLEGAARVDPDTALVFVAGHTPQSAEAIVRSIREQTGVERLLGCTAGGVIGGDREVEEGASVSLMLLSLPGVSVRTYHLTQEDVVGSDGPGWWQDRLGVEADDDPTFLLLSDPFSVDSMVMVAEWNEAFPGRPVLGGMASGAQSPGRNRLFQDEQVHAGGAVAAVLTGDLQVTTVVSQGCRPIGRHLVITRAEGNVIQTLGGRPALEVLQELLAELAGDDQDLAQRALLLGRVIDEHKDRFERGDFLIRNLVGADPQSGFLAVGDRVRTGQTVQFQLRDGAAADEDLQHLLDEAAAGFEGGRPEGALLFSCMGRGQGMYGEPNHDLLALQARVAGLPVAGFFCSGEIGPVGGQNFVHGFTSSVGFLSPAGRVLP